MDISISFCPLATLVDADSAFEGDRNFECTLYGGDALGDQRRLRHQAGAKAAVRHPVKTPINLAKKFGASNYASAREPARSPDRVTGKGEFDIGAVS